MSYTFFMVLYLLGLVAVMLVIRSVSVFIHEMGHAIPALLFTKGKVEVYIGSYGEKNTGWRFSLGRLTIYFKYNPFLWQGGICFHHQRLHSVAKNLIITLMGAVASVVVGVLLVYGVFVIEAGYWVTLIALMFLVSTVIDLFANLIPNFNPIKIASGAFVYNDGAQLLMILNQGYVLNPKIVDAYQCFDDEKWEQSVDLFKDAYDSGDSSVQLFKGVIYACLMLQDLKEAESWFKEYRKYYEFDEEELLQYASVLMHLKKEKEAMPLLSSLIDKGAQLGPAYCDLAYCYSAIGEERKALAYYQKALDEDVNDTLVLNNLGFTYSVLGEHEAAIPYFDAAIEIDPDFAYPWNNRGFAKIELGQLDEGLKDTTHSLTLKYDNAYFNRNMGVYYLRINDRERALLHLREAQRLNSDLPFIDKYIEEAEALPKEW